MIFARSFYSFGCGVESPAALVESALAAGHGRIVLADEGGLYGQLEMAEAAERSGVTAGAGARLVLRGRPYVFVCLEGGWGQLSSLVTAVRNPSFACLSEALSGARDTAAVARSPADAAELAESGYAGWIRCAVLPRGWSPLQPSSMEAAALSAGFTPIAFVPVLLASSERHWMHRMLRAAALHRPASSLPESAFLPKRQVMPRREALEDLFRDAPASLRGSEEIACSLGMAPRGPLVAAARASEEDAALRGAVMPRIEMLYCGSPGVLARAEEELGAIASAGLSGYFMSFSRIAERCRELGITASTRGSAGGSLVAFALGMSPVCPVRYGLSFARFFNRLRPDPPDIDLDVDSEKRDGLVAEILAGFGRGAAWVGAVVRYRRRSAFRLVAEASGLSPSDVDTLSDLVSEPGSQAWTRGGASSLLEMSNAFRGLPSHLTRHPCGIVAPGAPVDLVAPVETGSGGEPVIQLDLEGIGRLGLLKMDLLGQRGLTVISRVCEARGESARGLLARASQPEPSALRLLDEGMTIGVVHVESPAMRALLREMRIETLDDVARALALVRPGASAGGGRERFLAAARGGGAPLPQLREVLRESFGVMLYEEDVSEAARCLFGLDEAEADLLRRRLKRRSVGRDEFDGMCAAAGLRGRDADAAWEALSGSAGYGFCKAHAYAYAASACVSAFLKAAFPAEFMAAVLAGGGGFYDAATYVEEARRLGLEILPPGVNSSSWGAVPVPGGVMLGMSCVRGMGRAEFERLVSVRPVRHPADLLEAGCGKQLLRTMARGGCFDELGLRRSQALWGAECPSSRLFGETGWSVPDLPDHTPEDRAAMETESLGMPASLCLLATVERPPGTVEASSLDGRSPALVWGRVAAWRRLGAGGFLMLQDGTGVVDAFVPDGLFGQAVVLLRRPGMTMVARVVPARGGRYRAVEVRPGPLTRCAALV